MLTLDGSTWIRPPERAECREASACRCPIKLSFGLCAGEPIPPGLTMEGYTAAGPVVVSLLPKILYDVLMIPEREM